MNYNDLPFQSGCLAHKKGPKEIKGIIPLYYRFIVASVLFLFLKDLKFGLPFISSKGF